MEDVGHMRTPHFKNLISSLALISALISSFRVWRLKRENNIVSPSPDFLFLLIPDVFVSARILPFVCLVHHSFPKYNVRKGGSLLPVLPGSVFLLNLIPFGRSSVAFDDVSIVYPLPLKDTVVSELRRNIVQNEFLSIICSLFYPFYSRKYFLCSIVHSFWPGEMVVPILNLEEGRWWNNLRPSRWPQWDECGLIWDVEPDPRNRSPRNSRWGYTMHLKPRWSFALARTFGGQQTVRSLYRKVH